VEWHLVIARREMFCLTSRRCAARPGPRLGSLTGISKSASEPLRKENADMNSIFNQGVAFHNLSASVATDSNHGTLVDIAKQSASRLPIEIRL